MQYIKKLSNTQIYSLARKIKRFFILRYYSFIYHPLIIRQNTSDWSVFHSIFILKEFELPITVKPKLIIDAGAYTGLSALYFSSKYPQAKIIAIEPENSNFEILKKHASNNSNIFPVKAGLWYKNCFLKIINKNSEKWDFIIKEALASEPYDVKAITIDALLKQSGFTEIDILKIDIEGSEKELFSKNCNTWINKVKIIIIELHDNIRDGCSQALYSAINKNQWKEYRKGEKVILIRRDQFVGSLEV